MFSLLSYDRHPIALPILPLFYFFWMTTSVATKRLPSAFVWSPVVAGWMTASVARSSRSHWWISPFMTRVREVCGSCHHPTVHNNGIKSKIQNCLSKPGPINYFVSGWMESGETIPLTFMNIRIVDQYCSLGKNIHEPKHSSGIK